MTMVKQTVNWWWTSRKEFVRSVQMIVRRDSIEQQRRSITYVGRNGKDDCSREECQDIVINCERFPNEDIKHARAHTHTHTLTRWRVSSNVRCWSTVGDKAKEKLDESKTNARCRWFDPSNESTGETIRANQRDAHKINEKSQIKKKRTNWTWVRPNESKRLVRRESKGQPDDGKSVLSHCTKEGAEPLKREHD